ncbi:NAD(P)H-binding protein [Maribacter sp. 2210JD10-5]|uniref:NAD(P)H-binding protein n=1 Tax=Maribacter sp. 2210JD10-5 TaxID=3386272 RepID=UPI0039BCD3A2
MDYFSQRSVIVHTTKLAYINWMEPNGKIAIILGATGLTGGILLRQLLNDERYIEIKLFSRSSIGFEHPKITEFLVDLFDFEAFQKKFKANVLFCCIGTTASKTSDKELYRKIDYGIPLEAAKTAKRNGIASFLVISAMGANPKSTIFYNRIKGEMEREVLDVSISKTHILQPALIGGTRNESRTGEWIFKQVMKLIDPILIGGLKKYKSIRPEKIAKAMVWLDNHNYKRIRVPSDELQKLGDR